MQHMHLLEVLLAGAYLAAAVVVLVAIFRSHPVTKTDHRITREQPPAKRVKPDNDKRDAA